MWKFYGLFTFKIQCHEFFILWKKLMAARFCRSVLPLQTILQFDFTHFSLISFIDKLCWIFNNFSSGISSKFISKNFCSCEKRLEPAPFCRSTQFCSSIFPNSVLLKKNCWIWTIVRVASNPISMQDFFCKNWSALDLPLYSIWREEIAIS